MKGVWSMFGRKVVWGFVLTGVLLWMTGRCFGDAAGDLGQIEVYVKSGMFVQAEELCKSVAQNNPGSDSALKAQSKLAVVYIMTGRLTQADAEVDKLMSDFKSKAELATVLYGIVNRYKQVKDSQRASDLSERICKDYPTSEQAQRLQLDTGKERALGFIANGRFHGAEEEVKNLVSTCGSNPALGVTLFKIAREFKELCRYEEAGRVYQQIIQACPDSEFAGKARMAVDKLKIWKQINTGDVAGAQAGLEKLIKDYKDEDDLVHTVHGVALKFEEAGYYEQAKALYSRVVQDYPDSGFAARIPLDLKKCDILAMIGKEPFEKISQEVNGLLASHRGDPRLPTVIWRVGRTCYERAMRLKGQDSAEQAKALYGNSAEIMDIVINQLPSSVVSAAWRVR
jgi:TolA-binding protein